MTKILCIIILLSVSIGCTVEKVIQSPPPLTEEHEQVRKEAMYSLSSGLKFIYEEGVEPKDPAVYQLWRISHTLHSLEGSPLQPPRVFTEDNQED